MSTLQAVSGASAEQMNALSESAKELGSSTQLPNHTKHRCSVWFGS